MRLIKIMIASIFFMLVCATPTFAWTFDSLEKDKNVPDDCWMFIWNGDGGKHQIMDKDGTIKPVDDLMNSVTLTIEKEFADNLVSGKEKTAISASLDAYIDGASTKTSLWNHNNLSSYLNREKSTIVEMKMEGTNYKIFIPVGKVEYINAKGEVDYEFINQGFIARASDGFSRYKGAVKEGVTAGAIAKSFNVYNGYSDKQLKVGTPNATDASNPLTSGLMIIEEGSENGGHIFGGTGSSNIKYTLDYFYNPLLGKIGTVEKPLPINDTPEEWDKLTTLEDHFYITDEAVQIIINSDYIKFANVGSVERKGVMLAKNISSSNSNGVKPYAVGTTYFPPANLVDYKLRVIAPTAFELKDGKYSLSASNGFSLLDDKIRICLYDNKVYEINADGSVGNGVGVGEFSGITGDDLALYKYTVEDKTYGAVVLLKYKEAIANTTSDGDKVYLTGRDIIFNNNYSGNLLFDSPSSNMMDVVTDISGKSGVFARDFAFKSGTPVAVSSLDGHKKLTDNPVSSFQFAFSFQKGDTEGVNKGFVIYRNNSFVNDQSLTQWLSSDKASSLKHIKAEELLKKITGIFTVSDGKISYEDWQKMQKIRSELSSDRQGMLAYVIRVIALIFGLVLIIYSLLLMLAYWVDLFNTFTELSILNILTFSRLYPVTSKDDIAYLRGTKGDVKYVNFIDMLKIMIAGCFIGTLFVSYTPILKFFFNIYFYITTHLGGA